jgi:hypothetical protein
MMALTVALGMGASPVRFLASGYLPGRPMCCALLGRRFMDGRRDRGHGCGRALLARDFAQGLEFAADLIKVTPKPSQRAVCSGKLAQAFDFHTRCQGAASERAQAIFRQVGVGCSLGIRLAHVQPPNRVCSL